MIRPAGFWLGHPGALLSLPDAQGTLTRQSDRAVTYGLSASGQRRAYLSARRAPLRQWNVAIPRLRPDEAAILAGLLAYIDPPYVWVDPWSRVTNLLQPSTVGMIDCVPVLAQLGRQPLDGGGYAATAAANPTHGIVDLPPAPVVPDQPVTVSVYLASTTSATVTARFLDSNGAALPTAPVSAAVSGTDVLRRASVSVSVPPAAAVAVAPRVTGASIIANPAVTWSRTVLPFGAAGGVAQVVLSGLSEDVQIALDTPTGQRWADLSFTVTEVN